VPKGHSILSGRWTKTLSFLGELTVTQAKRLGAWAAGMLAAEAAGTDGDVGLGVTNTTGANSPNMQTTIQAASGMLGSAVFAADAYNGGANSGGIDGVNGQGSGTSSGVFGRGGPSGTRRL